MNENNTPVNVGQLLRPIAPIADLMSAHGELTEVIQKCMKDGLDFGKIPGTQRETLFKPGAERLLFAFGLYCDFEILDQDVDHDRCFLVKRKVWRNAHRGDKEFTWKEEEVCGLYRFVSKCRLINRKTGEVVGTGTGICSTLESKYSDRPRECENTVLKMADKRAMIAAVLITFGLSERFTQDEGDPETVTAEEVKVEPVAKAPLTDDEKEAMAFRFLRELEFEPEIIDTFIAGCKAKGYEKWFAIALQAKAANAEPFAYLSEKPAKNGEPVTAETEVEQAETKVEEEEIALTGEALLAAAEAATS